MLKNLKENRKSREKEEAKQEARFYGMLNNLKGMMLNFELYMGVVSFMLTAIIYSKTKILDPLQSFNSMLHIPNNSRIESSIRFTSIAFGADQIQGIKNSEVRG
ncbi:hypothetical protein SLE2022_288380 [Rubroshorea leprosula]